MNIAVILRKDTDNFTMALLIRQFIKRGHVVTGFALYPDRNHLYMFDGIDFPIRPAGELNATLLEQYDILISYPGVFKYMHWLMETNIYVIAYDNAYFDEPVLGTDLLLERGVGWRPELPCGHRAECARLVVGEPKHDTWNIKEIRENPKELLFIDSGHYPFGKEGKQAAAHFILEACKRFPEYHITVKPRFLKGDKSVTHQNMLFLYDFIEEEAGGTLPDNLTLLQKHHTPEGLIAAAHTVITMYTTAYLDAAAQGKPLLILDNLPNEEHPELRIKTHWMPAREIMKGSGCLIDYREALQYLPDGIPCRQEHLRRHIYSRGAVNEKFVTSVEWLWEQYISRGKYPAPGNYFYDRLGEAVKQTVSMKQLKILRKKNHLHCQGRYFYKDTAFYPDDGGIDDFIEELETDGSLENMPIETLISHTCRKLLEYAPHIPKDSISQDILMTQMVAGNASEQIFTLKRDDVANTVFYDYIAGRAYLNREQYEEASRHLHRYLDGCGEYTSATGLQDVPTYRLSGLFYCGMADMGKQDYRSAEACFLACEKETNGSHRKANEQLAVIRRLREETNASKTGKGGI